ncbi:hypothetical protein [Caulobacter sp. CCH9-E1]|uniref:hypothetical protein n=1 Tax=Caulobacter sp. CCH9-E1 TaxID=1768768 RepID=UPI00083744F5|nr:hypothetical protein [Caulobacter sp. CCH9-E1]
MSLETHDEPPQVTGSRRPLGYSFWTGAVLAVLGIALVLASGAGSLSPANALRMVLIGVSLELIAILLLFLAGAPKPSLQSRGRGGLVRDVIAMAMMVALLMVGVLLVLLPLSTNLDLLMRRG